MKYYIISIVIALSFTSLFAQTEKNRGKRANLVCLVRFADEAATIMDGNYNRYDGIFNDSSSLVANSVFNFYRLSSINQLRVVSLFGNEVKDGTFVPVQDSHNRNYFRASSILNSEGYASELVASLREANLINDLAAAINATISDDAILDYNNDGVIDNLTVIVSGQQHTNSVILYPHQSHQIFKETYIKGKRVGAYNIMFDDPLDCGTLCHEFMHTLGAPDLYLDNKTLPRPIGTWDLMATNTTSAPQGMSAYTLYKFGTWIDEPTVITEEGTYSLNPLNNWSKENVWYKFQEEGQDEFFVVEYRHKKEPFESKLPQSGLLVYRINPKYTGNSDFKVGQYLFRVGGTPSSEGTVLFAAMSEEGGRTSITTNGNPYLFYTNGDKAPFEITEIGKANDGGSISFYFKPLTTNIEYVYSGNNNIYFNRANRSLQIDNAVDISKIEIVDMRGNLIYSTTNPTNQIDINNISKGIYIIKSIDKNNNKIYTNKIVF